MYTSRQTDTDRHSNQTHGQGGRGVRDRETQTDRNIVKEEGDEGYWESVRQKGGQTHKHTHRDAPPDRRKQNSLLTS